VRGEGRQKIDQLPILYSQYQPRSAGILPSAHVDSGDDPEGAALGNHGPKKTTKVILTFYVEADTRQVRRHGELYLDP
jgi:hypothetical protein